MYLGIYLNISFQQFSALNNRLEKACEKNKTIYQYNCTELPIPECGPTIYGNITSFLIFSILMEGQSILK